MILRQFLESVGTAYIFGAIAFGALMWSTLNDVDVTSSNGEPMPKKYFILAAIVWPYSIYLLLQELKAE